MTSRRQFLGQASFLAGATFGCAATLRAAIDSGLLHAAAHAPGTLTKQQNELVATLTDLIIPATDTPGARAAGVGGFIDRIVTHAFSAGQRASFLNALTDVETRARAQGAASFVTCAAEQQAQLLRELETEAIAARPAATAQPPFFDVLRDLTLVGYYTSEIGATRELRYIHVAGSFDGDVAYAEVGRAYSY